MKFAKSVKKDRPFSITSYGDGIVHYNKMYGFRYSLRRFFNKFKKQKWTNIVVQYQSLEQWES